MADYERVFGVLYTVSSVNLLLCTIYILLDIPAFALFSCLISKWLSNHVATWCAYKFFCSELLLIS